MFLQPELERLHRDQFPNVFQQEEAVRTQLIDRKTQLASNPYDRETFLDVQNLREQLIFRTKASISYKTQKSKDE